MGFQKSVFRILLLTWSALVVGCQHAGNGSEVSTAHLRALKKDTGRIKGYLDKAYNFVFDKPDSADYYYRKAFYESQKINYNDGIVVAVLGITNRQFEEGRYDSCEYYYDIAERHAQTPDFDPSLYSSLMLNKGTFYYLKGDKVNADRSYLAGLEKARELGYGDSTIAMLLLYNLSFTKIDLKQPAQALEYLDSAASKDTSQPRDSFFLKSVLLVKAQIFLNQKKVDSARVLVNTFIKPPEEADFEFIKVISSIYIESNEPGKAIPYIEKGIADATKSRILIQHELMQGLLASAYSKMGRYNDALKVLKPSFDTSISRGLHESIAANYPILIDIYKKLGNYRQALELEQSYSVYKDSTLSQERAAMINDMNIRFKTEQKDLQLAENKLQLEEQQNRLLRQKIFTYVISAAALLLVGLLFIFRKLAIRKSKLKEQQILMLRQESEITALKSRMEGEEKERARLSMELHDGIASQLSSATLQFKSLKARQQELTDPGLYNDIEKLLDQTALDIRKTASNLMPDVLARMGLTEALNEYVHSVSADPKLNINLQIYGSFKEVHMSLQLFLYRIVQELVHNIVKHAEASEALVQVINNDQVISITVEDNGKGFEPAKVLEGSGLRNVEKRVEQMGGSFSIESSPEGNTTVHIELETKSFINV